MLTFGRIGREVAFDGQLAPKDTTFVGCIHRTEDIRLHVKHIALVEYHSHAYFTSGVPSGALSRHSLTCLPTTIATFELIVSCVADQLPCER